MVSSSKLDNNKAYDIAHSQNYSTPYFGGALCAKTDSDGNMIIEV